MTLDHCFTPVNTTQKSISDKITMPLIRSTLEGYNNSIIVYGNHNTGKTYTMFGKQSQEE